MTIARQGLLGRLKAANQSFNGLLGNVVPMNNAGGLLGFEQAQDARKQGQLALASSLLQASGPSLMPTTFAQNLGGGLAAGQVAQNQAVDNALVQSMVPYRQALMQAQIESMLAPPPPDKNSLQQKIETLQTQLGRKLTEKESIALAGGGTTINIGPQLSEQEQKEKRQLESAAGVVSRLRDMTVGPSGVLANSEPGVVNRLESAAKLGVGYVTQDNPLIAQYQDFSQGTVAPLVKSLGESGSLSTQDIQRALSLVPKLFPLPDTKEVAERKLNELADLLERGISNLEKGIKVEDKQSLPPLPDGFTLDPE